MYKIIGGDQKEYGPISAEQLREWIAQGRVGPQTPVLADDATQWKAMSEMPEFSFPAHAVSTSAEKLGTNGMAVAAFITSILSLLCCCFPFAVVSLVLAFIARSQLKKNPGQSGKGLATAAMIISIISILISIALVTSITMGAFNDLLPEGVDTYNL